MKPLRLLVRAFGPYAGEQLFDFAELRGRSFFLIHGPTGAGKTSVLDAICFALFGQASGPLRTARQLRSDHARPATLTEATFDFALGDRHFRVRRVPEQQRPRKVGAGLTTQAQEAGLWERQPGAPLEEEGRPIADGWSAVNDEVHRQLGYQVEQFRQVVMLPQGQFQRLLVARSDERQAILESLFEAAAFARIEQALKDSASEARRESDDANGNRKEVLRVAQADSSEALARRREAKTAELQQATADAKQLRDAHARAHEALSATRGIAEKLTERRSAVAAWEALDRRAPVIESTRQTLARARSAFGLCDVEASARERRADAASAETKRARARKELDEAAGKRHAADEALAKATAREPERAEASRWADRLVEMQSKVELLRQAVVEAAAAKTQRDRRAAEQASADKAFESAQSACEAARRGVEQARADAQRLDATRQAAESAASALEFRQRLESNRVEQTKCAKKLQTLASQFAKLERSLEEERTAFDRLDRAWRAGQAAVLARALAPGSACPVCGSTHHPAPAVGAGEVPSEADLEQRRSALQVIEAGIAKARPLLDSQRTETTRLESDGRVLQDTLGPRALLPVAELESSAGSTRDEYAVIRKNADELQARQAALESLTTKETSASAQRATAATTFNSASNALIEAESRVRERESGVPSDLRDPAALAKAMSKAHDRLRALERALGEAQQSATAAGSAAARAESALIAATDHADGAARRARESSDLFAKRLRDAGFADEAAWSAAGLSPVKMDAMEAEIKRYESDLASARHRQERASAAAQGLAEPDLPALEAVEKQAGESRDAGAQRVEAISGELAAMKRWLDRLAEHDAKIQRADARFNTVGALADAASGKNPYRMTFQRYVLGVFLDDVLAAATRRLAIMSQGRYVLRRFVEAGGGRSAGGLDLEVHDAHTGAARPAGTLSGGETFVASLSLALGLADVVQAFAGGIRLDTIFIDEGFGTLDPEALDLAIRALRDLQRGGRLVGIISHVAELKEWIDARLEITPTPRGSSARFVVG